MTKLLLLSNSVDNFINNTSFGGLPVKTLNSEIVWPKCKSCDAEMQYQGKIKTEIGFEMIFMCSNDPGMCDEWDAENGGNSVVVVNGNQFEYFYPQNKELSLRNTEYGVNILEINSNDYDSIRENWQGNYSYILGKIEGEPDWYQADETHICNFCNKPMRFVAQLEEGPNHQTNMNFGCGVGYLFDCVEHKIGKFLWQC